MTFCGLELKATFAGDRGIFILRKAAEKDPGEGVIAAVSGPSAVFRRSWSMPQLAVLGCQSPPPFGPVLPNPSTVKEQGIMILMGRGNFFLGRWVSGWGSHCHLSSKVTCLSTEQVRQCLELEI